MADDENAKLTEAVNDAITRITGQGFPPVRVAVAMAMIGVLLIERLASPEGALSFLDQIEEQVRKAKAKMH